MLGVKNSGTVQTIEFSGLFSIPSTLSRRLLDLNLQIYFSVVAVMDALKSGVLQV